MVASGFFAKSFSAGQVRVFCLQCLQAILVLIRPVMGMARAKMRRIRARIRIEKFLIRR